MSKKALVIGATGLLGYGVALSLKDAGWSVRAMGIENLEQGTLFPVEIEYRGGNFFDKDFLSDALKDVDKVFFFLSTTFPSTSSDSLEIEISRTLSGLDYLLRTMRECGVMDVVYPSSGGTIYGNVSEGAISETDAITPTTPYGVGKKMSEEVLRFYASQGFRVTVLRVGNVYGTKLQRNSTQGAIDVFIQKSLAKEPVTIWGDALSSVRDYIFLDDFAEAVAEVANYQAEGLEIYNLSSGVPTSLEEIINKINDVADEPLQVTHMESNSTNSIKRIVLDVSKLKKLTGWEPKFDISAGIEETYKRKKNLISIS